MRSIIRSLQQLLHPPRPTVRRRHRLEIEELETRVLPSHILPDTGTFRFSAASFTVSESSGKVTIVVDRDGSIGHATTVRFATSDGSGRAGVNYLAASGELMFGPNDRSRTFDVTLLNDNLPGPNNTVNLTLSSPGAGAHVGTPGSAVLTITDALPPPHPNSTFGTAASLGSTTTTLSTSDRINFGTHNQMFSFTVTTPGQIIRFDAVHDPTTPLDSFIRLFDASGNQLAFNDDALTPGGVASRDASLVFRFAVPGTYFVSVSGFPNFQYDPSSGISAVYGSVGAYTLTLTQQAPPRDTNDQLREARPLGARAVAHQTISTPDDVDLFRFRAAPGWTVTIVVGMPAGSTLAAIVRLFDARGRQLAMRRGGAGRTVTLTHTFARGGIFFVGVSGRGNERYNPTRGTGDRNGSTGRYSIAQMQGAPNRDRNGTRDGAVRLGVLARRRSAVSVLSSPADVDLFSFTVASGQRVRFGVDGGFQMRLFDGDGMELASSSRGQLAFTFLVGGNYIIGVSARGARDYDALTGAGRSGAGSGRFRLSATPQGRQAAAFFGAGSPAPARYNSSRPALAGIVFFDRSGDGQWQSGEVGQSSNLVILDRNGNGVQDDGEAATATNARGEFIIHGDRGGRVPVYCPPITQFGIPVEKITGPRQGAFTVNMAARRVVAHLNFGKGRYSG